ncbi:hypothetical protein F5Y17DRAFT_419524 [Xylariaceae sp. FL0594]|nr:hypothetical protein F5Y17DRAFT_419524 [Xylariaceae sp. FL0594]
MNKPICAGNPTLWQGGGPDGSVPAAKWPHYIAGYLCQTPPFGIFSAPGFAACCPGRVYNVTAPSSADEEETYPLSCAALCVVDPGTISSSSSALLLSLLEPPPSAEKKKRSPVDDFHRCIGDQGDGAGSSWELVCALNSVDAAPPVASSSPSPSTSTSVSTTSGTSNGGDSISHGPTTIDTISPPSPSPTITDVSPPGITSTSVVPLPTAKSGGARNRGRRIGNLQLWTGLFVVIVGCCL